MNGTELDNVGERRICDRANDSTLGLIANGKLSDPCIHQPQKSLIRVLTCVVTTTISALYIIETSQVDDFSSQFQFVIEQINLEQNLFAYILTKWSKAHRIQKVTTRQIRMFYHDIAPTSKEVVLRT